MNEHLNDFLKDVVQNTYGLGFIELIRVEGTADQTVLNAVGEKREAVVQAKTKSPIPEFIGVFGMPALGSLNTILGISEYKENAKITVTKKDTGALSGIHFENAAGDFKNDYRFMSEELATEKLKKVNFKGAKWLLTVTPTAPAIQKFGFQAMANADQTFFTYAVEDKNLKFFFGDHSSQAGSFVFETNVKPVLKTSWSWPIGVFKSIMALPGDKTIKFSDEGVMLITVDSGLIDYEYFILGAVK